VEGFHLEIEWDPTKAEANIRKHGVSFLLASTVLRDPLSVTVFDATHSEAEQRWITIDLAVTGECLLVSHTWVDLDAKSAKARIISARQAGNFERRCYEEGQ
jgi:hypothetical protein